MKKIIDSLRHELEHKIQSVNDAQKKIWELEKQIEKQDTVRLHRAEIGQERGFNEKLMEIIRWQINPGTAQYPFDKEFQQKTKRQRDEY